MKLETNYITNLKECYNIDSIWNLMENKSFFGVENSKFQDRYISLEKPCKNLNKMDLKLKNNFLELILRLMIFFKFDQILGLIPLGSGKISYVQDVRYILKKIQYLQPDITNFSELKTETIETIIDEYYKNNNKEISKGYLKLYKIIEFIKLTDDILPTFLQLDINIILNAKNFSDFKNDYHTEIKLKIVKKNKREPYDLSSLKTLMGYAINYIEKYAEDCIFATKLYIDINNQINKSSRNFYAYKLIKENTLYKFEEPTLKELQNNIISTHSSYLRKNEKETNNSIKKIQTLLINSSKRLESCCLLILLMTTGMRKSEAILLPRYPEIKNDEYFNLKRMVYKTASTEDGFEVNMPIPEITKDAIQILSEISELKDGKKDGNLIMGSFDGNILGSPAQRINSLFKKISEEIGIIKHPLPHQLRHAIAFLIVHINQKNGLELARLFLGHTSITMTLQYMGHYNILIKNAITELHLNESEQLIDQVINEIKDGRELYGKKGERLTSNYQFKGSYAEEFADLLDLSLQDLIKKGKLVIIQTPICICLHDLTKAQEMTCQRGFNIKNFIGEHPISSRCEGMDCNNAIFTESHIRNLNVGVIDTNLIKRLEKNKLFVESGGFKNNLILNIHTKNKEML